MLKPLKIYYSVFLHPRGNKGHHNSFLYMPPFLLYLHDVLYTCVCLCVGEGGYIETLCQSVFPKLLSVGG